MDTMHSSRVSVRRDGTDTDTFNDVKKMNPSEETTPVTLSIPKLTSTTATDKPSSKYQDHRNHVNFIVSEKHEHIQLQNKIRQLEKELEISKDNVERWKFALQSDFRPGSQYRQEIASLKQQLEDKDQLLLQKDTIIDNLTSSLSQHQPMSQNTSVCSSLLESEDFDTPQSLEMERLLKENSLYAYRLLEQEEELNHFRYDRVESEQECALLRRKVASLTAQHTAVQEESQTFKKERNLLQKQLLKVQQDLQDDEEMSRISASSIPFDVQIPKNTSHKDNTEGALNSSSTPRNSTRSMKRNIELQNELRKLQREREKGLQEIERLKDENSSLQEEVEKIRIEHNGEIKQLRNELWKAKVLSESMEDMVAELDQTKFALQGSRRIAEDTNTTLKIKFRDMNHTIVRLQSEIRKRDATIDKLRLKNSTGNDAETQASRQLKENETSRSVVNIQENSLDQTEREKKIQDMQTNLLAKNETIMQLQRDLRARTESLVKSRKELVEKEMKIEELESKLSDAKSRSLQDVEYLRKELLVRDEENQRLQYNLVLRGKSLAKSRLELSKKSANIKEPQGVLRSVKNSDDIQSSNFYHTLNENKEKCLRMSSEISPEIVQCFDKSAGERGVIERMKDDIKHKQRELVPPANDAASLEQELEYLRMSFGPNSWDVDTSDQHEPPVRELRFFKDKPETVTDEGTQQDVECQNSSPGIVQPKLEGIAKQILKVEQSNTNLEEDLFEKVTVTLEKEIEANDRFVQEINLREEAVRKIQKELDLKNEAFQELTSSKNRLDQALKESVNDLSKLKSMKNDLKRLLDSKELEIKKLRSTMEEAEKCAESKEIQLLDLQSSTKDLRVTLEQTKSEVSFMAKDNGCIRSLLREKEDEIKQLTNELEKHKENSYLGLQKLDEKDKMIMELQKAQNETSDTMEKSFIENSSLKKENDNLQKIIQELSQEKDSLIQKVESISADLHKSREVTSSLQNSVANLESVKESLIRNQDTSQKLLTEKAKENENLVSELEALKDASSSIRRQFDEKDTKLKQLEESKVTLKTKLEEVNAELIELANELDGKLKLLDDQEIEIKILKKELKASTDSSLSIQAKLDEVILKLEESEKSQRLLEDAFENAKIETRELAQSKENLETLKNSLTKEQEKYQILLQERENKNKILVEEQEALKKNLADSRRQLQDKDTSIHELRDLRKSLNDDLEEAKLEARRAMQEKENLKSLLDELQLQSVDVQTRDLKMFVSPGNEKMQNQENIEEVKRKSSEEINDLRQKIRFFEKINDQQKQKFAANGSKIAFGSIFTKKKGGDKSVEIASEAHSDFDIGKQISTAHDMSVREDNVQELMKIKANMSNDLIQLRQTLAATNEKNELLREDIQHRAVETAKLREEVSTKDAQIRDLAGKFDSLKELDKTRLELLSKEKQIIALNESNLESCKLINSLEINLESAREENKALKKDFLSYSGERTQLSKNFDGISDRADSLSDIRNVLDEGFESVCKLEKMQNDSLERTRELQRSLTFTSEENIQLQKDLEIYAHELAKARVEIEMNEGKFQSLDEIKTTLVDTLELLRQERAEKESLVAKLETIRKETSSAEDDQQMRIESMGEQIQDLHRELESRRNHLAKARHEILEQEETLTSLRKEMAVKDKLLADLKEFSSSVEAEMATSREKIHATNIDNKRLSDDVERKSTELTELRKSLILKSEIIESLQGEKQIVDEAYNAALTEQRETERLKNEQLIEIEDLKKRIRELGEENHLKDKEFKSQKAESDKLSEEIAQNLTKVQQLQKASEELDLARASNESLSSENRQLISEVKRMTESIQVLTQNSQERLGELEDERKTLINELLSQKQNFDSLSQEAKDKTVQVEQLNKSLAEAEQVKAANEELQKKNVYLVEQVEKLSEEVQKLKGHMAELENVSETDNSFVSLQDELEKTKKVGTETIQCYERHISALTMNKDVTIDTLRKDLAAARARGAEEIARLTNEASKLQEENQALRMECNDEAIRLRDQRIYALEHTLVAQEKTVDSLKTELEQLQLTMRSAAEQRRSDLEDLQKELMESQTTLIQKERECLSLTGNLDECNARYELDMKKLQEELQRLKKAKVVKVAVDSQRANVMNEVKERLEQLKVTNVELKKENMKLAKRLEKASLKVQTIEAEKQIAAEMEDECEELRRQVKELESQLESASGSTSKSRASESTTTISQTKGDNTGGTGSRAVGLGLGKRTKLKTWGKSKIPSVLFINKQEAEEDQNAQKK